MILTCYTRAEANRYAFFGNIIISSIKGKFQKSNTTYSSQKSCQMICYTNIFSFCLHLFLMQLHANERNIFKIAPFWFLCVQDKFMTYMWDNCSPHIFSIRFGWLVKVSLKSIIYYLLCFQIYLLFLHFLSDIPVLILRSRKPIYLLINMFKISVTSSNKNFL